MPSVPACLTLNTTSRSLICSQPGRRERQHKPQRCTAYEHQHPSHSYGMMMPWPMPSTCLSHLLAEVLEQELATPWLKLVLILAQPQDSRLRPSTQTAKHQTTSISDQDDEAGWPHNSTSIHTYRLSIKKGGFNRSHHRTNTARHTGHGQVRGFSPQQPCTAAPRRCLPPSCPVRSRPWHRAVAHTPPDGQSPHHGGQAE